MTAPSEPRSRRHFPVELQAKAATLAAIHGVTKAAEELNLPHQRVSEWFRAADSSDLRNFVQAKGLEAAAEVLNELPDLLNLAAKRARALLEDDSVHWNGTQMQAALTALGIYTDIGRRLMNGGDQGRYGSGSSGTDPLEPGAAHNVLAALEASRPTT